jgi:uncharacterized protein (DUF302 family)
MLTETRYGLRVNTALTFDQAVAAATAALKEQGFGVLSTIEIDKALKEKIGAEFRRYTILGACNPPLALRALTAELEIGLLLPCNVIVYEGDGGNVVAAIAPLPTMGMVGNPDLQSIAAEADARLRRALEDVAGRSTADRPSGR